MPPVIVPIIAPAVCRDANKDSSEVVIGCPRGFISVLLLYSFGIVGDVHEKTAPVLMLIRLTKKYKKVIYSIVDQCCAFQNFKIYCHEIRKINQVINVVQPIKKGCT